jgi:hypothetical protein
MKMLKEGTHLGDQDEGGAYIKMYLIEIQFEDFLWFGIEPDVWIL